MKTVTCETAQAQLVDHVEGELDDARRAAIEEHVAACPNCRRELQEIERLRGALGRESARDPGAVFWEKFPDQMWRVYQAELAERRSGFGTQALEWLARMKSIRGPVLWIPVAAALVVSVSIALFFVPDTSTAPGIAGFQARVQDGKGLVQAGAGSNKVAFPEGFEKGTLYATVDRHDIKQFRELYASPGVVEAVRKGRAIPSGAVLTQVQYRVKTDDKGNPVKGPDGRFVKDAPVAYSVMEKRTGWGTEYPPELRNGEWEFQTFTPDKKPNPKANLTACFQCHKALEKQDFVVSLASLSGTAPGGSVAR